MGPDEGTLEYRAQVEDVLNICRLSEPENSGQEDQIIAMFAMDTSYSRRAIMEAIGLYKRERNESR